MDKIPYGKGIAIMRSQSIQEIMARIAVAEIDSPIAVFLNPDGTYRSQFAAPLNTRRMLDMRPPSLVGVWCRHDNQNEVLAALGYSKPKGRKYPVSSWTRGLVPV